MKDKDYEQLATKIMINALEGVKAQIRKAYDKGYVDGYAVGYDHGKTYEDKQKQDDWRDIPSDEMTLEQARRAVKELRAEAVGKILAEGE